MSFGGSGSSGTLSRANEAIIYGRRADDPVFTIEYWQSSSSSNLSSASSARSSSSGAKLLRVGARVGPIGADSKPQANHARLSNIIHHPNRAARSALVKLEDSTLSFLVRWAHHDRRYEGASRCNQDERKTSFGGATIASTVYSDAYKPAASRSSTRRATLLLGKRCSRPTRSSLLLHDVDGLPDRKFGTVVRFVFWRWLTWTNLVELALLLLLAGSCFYQIYELLSDYYQYTTHLSVIKVLNDDFRTDLPAITICSHNRISRETLAREFPALNVSHFLAISYGRFESVDNYTLPNLNDASVFGDIEFDNEQGGDQTIVQNSDEDPDIWQADEGGAKRPALDAPVSEKRMWSRVVWPKVARYLSENRPALGRLHLPDYAPIDMIQCANIWGQQVSCGRLRRVESLQMGMLCHTLFHDSTFWDSRAPEVRELEQSLRKATESLRAGSTMSSNLDHNHKDMFDDNDDLYDSSWDDRQSYYDDEDQASTTTHAPPALSEQQTRLLEPVEGITPGVKTEMGSSEMVRLRVNFRRRDYADSRAAVGALLAVHSNSMVGKITHEAHIIEPGHWYNFYVARFDYQRLPAPYDTRCHDYEQNRYVWLDRAAEMRAHRDQINDTIMRQASDLRTPHPDYVNGLRRRTMSMVGRVVVVVKPSNYRSGQDAAILFCWRVRALTRLCVRLYVVSKRVIASRAGQQRAAVADAAAACRRSARLIKVSNEAI